MQSEVLQISSNQHPRHRRKPTELRTCLSIHANDVDSSDIQCVAASRNSNWIAKLFTLTGVYQRTAAPSTAGSCFHLEPNEEWKEKKKKKA